MTANVWVPITQMFIIYMKYVIALSLQMVDLLQYVVLTLLQSIILMESIIM